MFTAFTEKKHFSCLLKILLSHLAPKGTLTRAREEAGGGGCTIVKSFRSRVKQKSFKMQKSCNRKKVSIVVKPSTAAAADQTFRSTLNKLEFLRLTRAIFIFIEFVIKRQ